MEGRASAPFSCTDSTLATPKSFTIMGIIGRNINAAARRTSEVLQRLECAVAARRWSLDRVRCVPLPSPPLRLASVRRRHPLSHGVSRSHDPFALLAG